MKLGSLKSNDPKERNGQLILISRDNQKALRVNKEVARTLLEALQNWSQVGPKLSALSKVLNDGKCSDAFALQIQDCLAPIPNAPAFFDGSAFLSHVVRARKARGDSLPESAKVTPLMYQGVSDLQLSPFAPIEIMDESFGGDFEAEFAVIVDDVPKGTKASSLDSHLVLFGLFNDITLREILKKEIETKFGFLQSKPNSAWAPFFVTRDEFGTSWKDGRIQLEAHVQLNRKLFGHPNGKEMHFSFHELVAHACRTRPLSAGTIIGSGTISNEDASMGYACLTEKRYVEVIENGKPSTPWLKPGDEVQMDVQMNGISVFGAIQQKVTL